MKITTAIGAALMVVSMSAQDFGQRKGFRGIVPKKEKTIVLDEVEVSTSLGGESYARSSKQVTVITAKEIQELPVANINELLELVAGVDMRQRGPLDIQGDLGIRGGTFDQTLVLVNGVRMNNPQTGHHNMNLPVPLSMIDRIEIIHGGAANAHGIGAMTGVVNIIIKEAKPKLNGGYMASSGQNNLLNSSFYAGMKLGEWGIQLGHQYQQTSGYVANTDFENGKLYVQLARPYQIRNEQGKITLMYAENKKAFGAQNYYTSAFPDQFEATSTKVFAFKLDQSLGQYTALKFNVNQVSGTDRFELYRETAGLAGYDASSVAYTKLASGRYYRAYDQDSAATWYSGPNFHRTRVMNSNILLGHTWNVLHETNFGLVSRSDLINSNVLGEVDENVGIPGWDDYMMDKMAWSGDVSVFAEHTYTTERLKLAGSIMYNNHIMSMSETTNFWAPSADLTYRITPKGSIFSTINRSVRYPTYTDLFYNRGGAQGSIDLNPESAWNFEAGYKYHEGLVHWNAAMFHRRSRDLIDWVTYAGDPIAYASNITSLALTGVDGSFLYTNSKRKAKLKSLRLSGVFMNGRTPKTDFSSLYALDYLQAKVNAQATQKIGMGFFATYGLTVQDRVGTYMNTAGQEVNYDPFAIVDLKLYYAPTRGVFKRQFPFQAFININNALDATYYDRGNVPQPGRWISSGFEFRFR